MKPLDFGAEGVTGSVNAQGRIIALNFYHPQHGYVTLTSADPFPESERYNPPAVRAYRASLTELDGYGLSFDVPITTRHSALLENALPQHHLTVSGVEVTVTTFPNGRGAVQTVAADKGLPLRWSGKLCLQRCAYSQLTEGGPLPMPPLSMDVYAQDDLLIIQNPNLGAAVAIAGLNASNYESQQVEHPLELAFALAPAASAKLTYGVGLTVEEATANVRWLYEHASTEQERLTAYWRQFWSDLSADPLVRRAIVYGLMMAVPVGEGVCLLTDHMLLPLSWNRDAYFVARALLSAGQSDVVRRHLLWTYETAEHPDGMWVRCYTANGRVKDPAFQLDQQLYPLLELAEYVLETNDQETFARLRPHVDEALVALGQRRAGDALLFSTDETSADDPITLPYAFSSHVLLWHTLNRLNALGVAGKWAERIEPLRATIQDTFITEHDGSRLYAYAADGTGHFHFYHDANDFPLALAPAWRFVSAGDPVWRATVDFAFSHANKGGVYAGQLGSVHTPAPWPLGDVQDLIIAQALDDTARAERARGRLHRAAQEDGSLPEAYDAQTGEVVSRHWFAWPNAAYACVELGAFEPATRIEE